MQSYLKTKPVWMQVVLFFGMALGLFVVIGFTGSLVLSKITGISILEVQNIENWDFKQPGQMTFMRGMLALQFLGLFLIPTLLFGYFSDPYPAHYLGLKPPSKNIYWIIALVALLLAIPLIDYIGVLNQKINFGGELQKWVQGSEEKAAKQTKALLSGRAPSDLVLNLIFIALFAGIGEELLFRGVLQRLFIKAFKSPWAGIVIAAFLFSFFHFQFLGFFPRFVLGIVLGALYWYSGSLYTAMLAHFVYDGFIVTLLYFKPELANNPEASMFNQSGIAVMALLSAVAVGFLFWLMKKFSASSYHQVYASDNPETPKQDFTF
jgi:membrane protease YdiL (CAAX protease family)